MEYQTAQNVHRSQTQGCFQTSIFHCCTRNTHVIHDHQRSHPRLNWYLCDLVVIGAISSWKSASASNCNRPGFHGSWRLLVWYLNGTWKLLDGPQPRTGMKTADVCYFVQKTMIDVARHRTSTHKAGRHDSQQSSRRNLLPTSYKPASIYIQGIS